LRSFHGKTKGHFKKFTTEDTENTEFQTENNIMLLNNKQMNMDFIKVFLFPDSVLQCGRLNQHVGSSSRMRWLPQTGCAQSARLLFAASVRKQAGATNLKH
jgi:hypothetical protein